MRTFNNLLVLAAFAAAIGTGAIAISTPASAAVVCNRFGDCWHTDRTYKYDRDLHVVVHPDDWYFHHDWDNDHDMHWRAVHEGRGYWRNGVWVTF